MVEAGCMESPHVDYVTGLHVMPTHETGEIEIRYGDLNASSDEIHIKVHGKSCHGAILIREWMPLSWLLLS